MGHRPLGRRMRGDDARIRLTQPPAQVKNPWKADSSGIAMNTPMNRLVGSEWNLDDPGTLGIQLDFSDVDSCTAKGYPFKGCMMAVDVRKMFTSLDTDFKAIMGVKVDGVSFRCRRVKHHDGAMSCVGEVYYIHLR